MKIKFSEMSNMIAQEVLRTLAPSIRKVVREEVSRGVIKIIKEQRELSKMLSSNNSYDFDECQHC